jgi:ParB family chromosome partitioning protein
MIENDSSENELKHVPLDLISRSPYQSRRDFDPAEMRQLAQSIDQQGLLQPVVVRKLKSGSYQLVAGERRLRAHHLISADTILCTVTTMNDSEAHLACLVENLQRKDLNVIEEAESYQSLVDLGNTHEEVSHIINKSRSQITNSLRLLKLPEEIREYLEQGQLESGHAKLLVTLKDFQQINLGRLAATKSWSVQTLQSKVSGAKSLNFESGGVQNRQDKDRLALENSLSEHVGSPCKITSKKGRAGQLIIDYGSAEILEGILEKLGYSPKD